MTKEEIDRYLKEKHPELHFKEKKGYPSIRDCYFANVEALEDCLRKREERLKRDIEILRQNRLEGQSGPITPIQPERVLAKHDGRAGGRVLGALQGPDGELLNVKPIRVPDSKTCQNL